MATPIADQYGAMWRSDTLPGQLDRPPGAHHDRSFPFQVARRSALGGLSEGPFLLQLGADLYWSLECRMWRYTPSDAAGRPGAPLKLFHCAMDPNTILHAPVVEVRENSNEVSVTGMPPARAHFAFGIESINVRMGFKDPRVLLINPGIGPDAQRGAASSSVNYNFSGGFFGLAGTGSASVSFSHTASVSLTDYVLTSKSTTTHTDSTIAIEMLGDGTPYSEPDFRHPLPTRATSDTNLMMQGIWEMSGDIVEVLEFVVDISVNYIAGGDANEGWSVREPQLLTMVGRDGLEMQPKDVPWESHLRKSVSWSRTVSVPTTVVDKVVTQGMGVSR